MWSGQGCRQHGCLPCMNPPMETMGGPLPTPPAAALTPFSIPPHVHVGWSQARVLCGAPSHPGPSHRKGIHSSIGLAAVVTRTPSTLKSNPWEGRRPHHDRVPDLSPWRGCGPRLQGCAACTPPSRRPLPPSLPTQFVDDIIAQLLAFKPEVAQLLGALEERVYFTKRTVRALAPAWFLWWSATTCWCCARSAWRALLAAAWSLS